MIKCKALSSFIARETSGYKAGLKMIDCVMYVIVQASVVRKMDSAIHFINLYPMDSAIIGFPNTYPPDRDLSDG